ncbi:MAG TPA: RNA 2',3'-cyclic phosphodiesterase [candidate division Zixibacteria bacterium]|nr:RNA 2',3'-cyclic phosphodiesterase [candidate division Zixibacteria bacterium]
MMRLFIAAPLPNEIENYLGEIISDLRPEGRDVKWVKASNIHVTLRFLGDTEERLVPSLKTLIDKTAAGQNAVDTSVSGIGAFPNLRRPSVFWVGLGGGVESLADMADRIEQGVRELGFEPESKRFKPHLTIGRVRRDGDVRRLSQTVESYRLEPRRFRLNRIVLFQSTLTPQGPIYRRLHETALETERFEG